MRSTIEVARRGLTYNLTIQQDKETPYSKMEYTEGGEKMKYGSILKACRERAGFNQEELAHRLHVNQSDISKYETDVKEPSMSTFQDWTAVTQTQEVLVAFICGVEGLTILTEILTAVSTVVAGFIKFF